jgi:hypothetical protein
MRLLWPLCVLYKVIMQGVLELLISVVALVWVLGPLARWQYEREQREARPNSPIGNDSASSCDARQDPLASHPYYRPCRHPRF